MVETEVRCRRLNVLLRGQKRTRRAVETFAPFFLMLITSKRMLRELHFTWILKSLSFPWTGPA